MFMWSPSSQAATDRATALTSQVERNRCMD